MEFLCMESVKKNKKLAELKSRKAKKLIASNHIQQKLISELAAKKGIPIEIENIIVKKARLPINPKLKKDIKVVAQFRKLQNKYYGSKIIGEAKWVFFKLNRKYCPGFVNALTLDIKDNIHPKLFLWIGNNWEELTNYIAHRTFMTKSSTHFITNNYTNNLLQIPSKINFRILVININNYLWALNTNY